MKRFLALVFAAVCLTAVPDNRATAQVTLGTSPYVQDFNTVGSGLPVGWTVRTGATTTVLGTSVSLTSTATMWNNAAGAFKNFASATGLTSTTITTDQASSTNRVLGVRQTGSFGDPGAAFVLQLDNTKGSSNFSLTFKLQSLDGGTAARTATWVVDYGFGAAPTSFTAVATAPSTLTTMLSPSGWGSVNVTVNFGTALDDNGSNVWIRIVSLSATVGSGSRPSTGIDDVQLSYSSGDKTPPIETNMFPRISNYTTTGFDFTINLNEPGKTYFEVLPDGAPIPSIMQVKNSQDAAGNPLPAGSFGAIDILEAQTDYTATLSSLISSTDYLVYYVSEDVVPNVQPGLSLIKARTNTVGDIDAPVFASTYPKVDNIIPTGFRFRTNVNETGMVYYVVVEAKATAPTAIQVKNGLDGNNVAVPLFRAVTLKVNQPNVEETYSITAGYSPDTSYDLYTITEDNVPNVQAIPLKISFTTGKQFIESFNSCDGVASFTQYSVSGDQIWTCTDFGRSSGGIRMNGFTGTAQQNEDWLISPLVSLKSNPFMSFYSQFSFAGIALKLKISTDYIGTGSPTAATWTDLNATFPTFSVGSSSTAPADWTFTTIDLANYPNQNVYLAFVYTSTATAAARWSLDEITFNNATATYIQTTPAALSFKASGTSKPFTLKGFDLQNPVTIMAPVNFQVSRDNVTFSDAILYSPHEINAQKTIYVKFSVPGIAEDTYSGSVYIMSTGLATKTILLKGTDLTQTFDVSTYNLEFFGTDVKDTGGTEFGPVNDALQIANVTTVLQNVEADIFAVEEVADDNAFDQLVTALPGYDKILSTRWSYSFNAPDPNFPPQKIGFIFKTSTVQLVSQRVMFEQFYDDIKSGIILLAGYPGGTASSFWSSGRLPFMVTFDVTINGSTRRIRMVDIHAKSGSAQPDYDRRKFDIQVLHDSLNVHYPNENIILLGDFNDDVIGSINAGAVSTYQPFVDDASNFNILTYALTQTTASTFPSSGSFLDHIITSNELTASYVSNSISIEDPRNYISNYSSTTSDHLPVTARFLLRNPQSITLGAMADKTFGEPPFALTGSASSGLIVGYTTTSDKILIAGSQVTIIKPGRVTITASQAGNDNFTAASPVDQSFCIKPSKPTISISNSNTETPILTSSAASGNHWYRNGTPIMSSTANTLNVISPGIYKVQSKADDCVSAFSSDTPIIFTGDTTSFTRIIIYPNPAVNYVEVAGIQNEITDALVVDMMGKINPILLQKNGDAYRGSVEHLSNGVYLLRIQEGSLVYQIKLIKH